MSSNPDSWLTLTILCAVVESVKIQFNWRTTKVTEQPGEERSEEPCIYCILLVVDRWIHIRWGDNKNRT